MLIRYLFRGGLKNKGFENNPVCMAIPAEINDFDFLDNSAHESGFFNQ